MVAFTDPRGTRGENNIINPDDRVAKGSGSQGVAIVELPGGLGGSE